MKKLLRILLFGIIIWLIPFIIAIPFYSKNGLIIDIFLFKSIMIVIGTFVGAKAIYFYFKKATKNYCAEGFCIGIVWLAISLLLDLIILVPMMDVSIGAYFGKIGMRYLAIPIMSIMVGHLLTTKAKQLKEK